MRVNHENFSQFVFGPIGFIVVWLLAGWLGVINPLFVPTLPAVLNAAAQSISDLSLIAHLGATSLRVVLGFGIAVVIGVPLGLILGASRRLYHVMSVIIDFLRSVPGTALFPLFLLLFGVGDQAKIANAVFACVLIIIVNVVYGVMSINENRVLAARTMGASRAMIYRDVILPGALPAIVGGLRIALSIALVVIVVTEMFIGTSVGLGRLIFHSYELFQIPEMYVGIISAGIFGYLLNRIIVYVEERVIHWTGK